MEALTVVSPSRFSEIPRAASRCLMVASAARAAARSERNCASATRTWSGCCATRGLHHGELGGRGVVLIAGAVHVAGGDDLLGEELLVALQLRSGPVDLRLGPGHLGLEGGQVVLDALERGLARRHGGLGPDARFASGVEVGARLVHRELELAAVVLGQRRARRHPVAEIGEELGDGAGLLGLGQHLFPRQEAAARLHRPLHRARFRPAHRDGNGLRAGGRGSRPSGCVARRSLSVRLGTATDAGEQGDEQERGERPDGHRLHSVNPIAAPC